MERFISLVQGVVVSGIADDGLIHQSGIVNDHLVQFLLEVVNIHSILGGSSDGVIIIDQSFLLIIRRFPVGVEIHFVEENNDFGITIYEFGEVVMQLFRRS